jgi:hypothetical protein
MHFLLDTVLGTLNTITHLPTTGLSNMIIPLLQVSKVRQRQVK